MVGVNAGGLLNIFIFEVGMTVDDEELRSLGRDVFTVAVHPMLVAPKSIQYTNPSRGNVSQNLAGAVLSHGGKGLRTVSASGTFGVESRAAGPFFGTGAVRYRRFYDEVVRLSEALSSEDVAACRNLLTESLGLGLTLRAYVPDRTVFWVNFYDLLNDRSMQVLVNQWGETRSYDQGGASGAIWYNVGLQEVGPIVRGSPGTDLLAALFDGLTTWSQITDAIESLDIDALIAGQVGLAEIFTTQLQNSLSALTSTADDVRRIFGASSDGAASVASGATYLAAADSAEQAAGQLLAQHAAAAQSAGSMVGVMDPATADEPTRLGPDAFWLRQAAVLHDAQLNARLATRIGRSFGLSDATFRTLVLAGGDSGVVGLPSPDLAGSVTHQVTPWDLPAHLEARYGIAFDRICAYNNLDPLQALFPGRVLTIPRQRPRGPIGADGLPIFGEHAGAAAFGADLDLELSDADSDLAVISGDRVLAQGVQILILDEADALLRDVQVVPPKGQPRYLAMRLERALTRDERLTSVRVQTDTRADQVGYDLTVTAETITRVPLSIGAELTG